MHNAIVVFFVIYSFCQNTSDDGPILFFSTPMKSPCLCGQVRDEYASDDDGGKEGFLIEEVTSDLKQVIQSTYSDKNGLFEFNKILTSTKMHYICVSKKPLFMTTCYKVKLSKKAKNKLDIKAIYN
jgi:hypothetical protein